MAFDPEKVDPRFADLFYHGKPGPDGKPEGLTDKQWDAQKAEKQANGSWPFDEKEEA